MAGDAADARARAGHGAGGDPGHAHLRQQLPAAVYAGHGGDAGTLRDPGGHARHVLACRCAHSELGTDRLMVGLLVCLSSSGPLSPAL